jgi:Protein of unknown function (DUF2889)
MIEQLPIHKRAYDVDAFIEDDVMLRMVGHMRDVKPGGLWNVNDPQPLTVHHMQLDLLIDIRTLMIVSADAQMHVTPHSECPNILGEYQQLVGLSIARGFNNKVRELFGGPRGCTHIGALVLAMAPVTMQCLWTFAERNAGRSDETGQSEPPTIEQRRAGMERNRGTCHVWADDGPMFALLNAGEDIGVPLWAEKRLSELGLDNSAWRSHAK